jgi:rubredoxin
MVDYGFFKYLQVECDDVEVDVQEWAACPQCSGQAFPMGDLGDLRHYRCRQCGWEFAQRSPDVQVFTFDGPDRDDG